jgi:hypothetical protein
MNRNFCNYRGRGHSASSFVLSAGGGRVGRGEKEGHVLAKEEDGLL